MSKLETDIQKTIANNEDVIREALERYLIETGKVDKETLREDLHDTVTDIVTDIYRGETPREYARVIQQEVDDVTVESTADVRQAAARGQVNAATLGSLTGGLIGSVVGAYGIVAVTGDPANAVAAPLAAIIAILLLHGLSALSTDSIEEATQ